MRIPLTKYGLPEVVLYPAVIVAAMVVLLLAGRGGLGTGWLILGEAVLGVLLVWALSFFRDPARECPSDEDLLLAPADGRVTEIATVHEEGFISGEALRIGIFLSIFDAHINRAPCAARVERITYRKGTFKNALRADSGRVNESNAIMMVRTAEPRDRLVVRQVSGAIARRIVCDVLEGQQLTAGQKVGMIKFGSRTELYVPRGEGARCLVRPGQKVKAGLTPLVRYERCRD